MSNKFLPLHNTNKYEQLFKKTVKNDDVIISIKARALDLYSAGIKSEKQINKILSIINFFAHDNSPTYNKRCLVYDEQNCPYILGLPKGPMSKRAKEILGTESEYIGLLLYSIGNTYKKFNKLSTALELHGTSLQTNDTSNQLLNLWTAIESMFPVPVGTNSRISYFLSCICPILRLNYFRKIIYNAYKDSKEMCESFFKTYDKYNDIDQFTKLLCIEDCEKDLKEFYELLDNNILLRNRIFSLSKKISSGKDIYYSLESHLQKIRWHIHRIYRCRNFLVHSGDRLPYQDTLVENLHNYLDTALYHVANLMVDGVSIKSVNDAVEKAKMDILLHDIYLKKNFSTKCSPDNYKKLIYWI